MFLKIFGCEAFAHLDKENRTKLDAKSLISTFVGYRVDDLRDFENHKIIRCRDIIFNEKVMYKEKL